MGKRSRFVLIGVGVVVALLVAALVSIPIFLNADSFRTRIEATLSNALGRKVTVGKLDLSLWSGSLVAQNAAVADDPAFSNQPFLQASLVKIYVELLPLILSRQIHIKGFELTAPKITLLRAGDGTWNYSSIGGAATKTPETQKETGSMIPSLTVGHIDVSGGELSVGSIPAAGAASTPTRIYSQLGLAVKNFSFAKSFPFTASATLPDAGRVSISGTAGPVNPQDASLTPFAAHLELRHLNPVAAGMLDSGSGITGLIDGIYVDAAWSGHELHIAKFLVDTPRLTIVHAATPAATAPAAAPVTAPASNSMFTSLSADSVQVKNGAMTFTTPGPGGSTAVYQQINAEIKNYSSKTASPFNLSAQLSRGESLNASGNLGPLNQQNAAATPLDAQISLKHFDLAANQFIAPGAGIGGLLNLDAKVASDGHTLNANGIAQVAGLRLAKTGSPSSKPVDLRFAVSQNMQALAGQILHSTVTMGGAVVNIAGTYQIVGAATQVNLKADAPGLSIDELQAFLPSAGINLPPGSRLQGGTLSTSLNITGPIANPIITGPLRLDNTQLAGFNLGSKLSSIAGLIGAQPGSATVIRSLSMNLSIAAGAIRTDNLVLVAPALGSATGSGTVAASGALDYHVNLKVAALGAGGGGAAGAGGIGGQLLGMIPGGATKSIGGLAGNALKGGIPITVGGTTANPTFAPNLSGMLGGARGAAGGASSGANKGQSPGNSVGNALGGLLSHH
jgi:AsmA protein